MLHALYERGLVLFHLKKRLFTSQGSDGAKWTEQQGGGKDTKAKDEVSKAYVPPNDFPTNWKD